MLCHRLKSQHPSLGWDDLIHNIQKAPIRGFSALALAPESVLEEVQNKCDEAIVAACEQYNARLPVNTLPPELLSNIFQLGLEDYEWYTAGDHPAVVSLVCRRWNRVAVNSPSLWARWCDDDGRECFKRGRILSKSMGLSFYSRYTDDDILYQLTAEVGRWENVSFQFFGDPNRWLGHLRRLGNRNAPKLRKLRISVEWIGISHEVLNLFNPHDPCRLEDLALIDVPVVWNGLKFQHLRRLQISELYDMAPSLDELLWILERSPRLEYLCLSDMKIHPANPELSGTSPPVPMDFLTYLQLDFYDDDVRGNLVRMMRFPNCRQIKLHTITAPDPDSVYSLTHLLEATRHSIAVTETKVFVGCYNLEICTGGREVQIDIEGEPELALSEFIKISTAALAASPAVTLILKDNFSYKWTMHVISALAPLRSITALKFLGRTAHDKDEDEDEDEVCNPLDCLVHVMQHAFPRLRTLQCCINTVSELESLRQVVQCRHQMTAGQEKAELLPLKEVDIGHQKEWGLQGCCDATFDKIQALIPGGNLKILSQRWGTGPILWNANWRDSLMFR